VIALHLRDSRVLAHDFRKTARKRSAGVAACGGLTVFIEAHRTARSIAVANARETVRKLLRSEREPHGIHAARYRLPPLQG